MTLEELEKYVESVTHGESWELDLEEGVVEDKDGFAVCVMQPFASMHTIIAHKSDYSIDQGKFIAAAPDIIRKLIQELNQVKNDHGS